jgi:hypothetical protein
VHDDTIGELPDGEEDNALRAGNICLLTEEGKPEVSRGLRKGMREWRSGISADRSCSGSSQKGSRVGTHTAALWDGTCGRRRPARLTPVGRGDHLLEQKLRSAARKPLEKAAGQDHLGVSQAKPRDQREPKPIEEVIICRQQSRGTTYARWWRVEHNWST